MAHAADIRAILSLSITISSEIYIDPPTYPNVPHFVAEYEANLEAYIQEWWQNFINSKRDEQHIDYGIATASASGSSSSIPVQYPPASKVPFYRSKTFSRVAFIFSAFTIRASDIITESPPYTNTHALFNLLRQLYHDLLDVENLQEHRDTFDTLPPHGWTEPPVRRTPTCTTPQDGSHSPQRDNNISSNSQVNVQDVRSTPSTYFTSLCTLNILSAGPPGSPAVTLGTLTDPWRGMNKLELPDEQEFPLLTNHGPAFYIREYQGLIKT